MATGGTGRSLRTFFIGAGGHTLVLSTRRGVAGTKAGAAEGVEVLEVLPTAEVFMAELAGKVTGKSSRRMNNE